MKLLARIVKTSRG